MTRQTYTLDGIEGDLSGNPLTFSEKEVRLTSPLHEWQGVPYLSTNPLLLLDLIITYLFVSSS